MTNNSATMPLVCVCVVAVALFISGINPFDRVTWWLEIAPVLIGFSVLAITYKSFCLSNFLYGLITLHSLVLILGGAYSYARVPLGFSLQELFDLSRNPYDKIGHFVQGFVPVFIAREILLRINAINGKKILAFICICITLSISACYELIEWAAALVLDQGAEEFLGTQGYEWDTQSDMGYALLGATLGLLLLSKWHDRAIKPFLNPHP